MLLNAVEKALMNNPARSLIQRHVEARRLLTMGGARSGGRALEVGCGRGIGASIILDLFGADEVDAFDLDPHMVGLAERRLEPYGDRVRLWVGDVVRIPCVDNSYDAVFDFGIIHHVPDWRDGLKEIHRVLKPGGRLYAEEVLAAFIHNPLWRRLLDHPMEDRFDASTFTSALDVCGFVRVASKSWFQWFSWFVADKPA